MQWLGVLHFTAPEKITEITRDRNNQNIHALGIF
jgi:hypothetical protein